MGSFSDQLGAFATGTVQKIDRFFYVLVSRSGERLLDLSPVDTGFFRANWHYSEGAPNPALLPLTGGNNGFASIPIHAAGTTHYLQNNTAYAWPLERGHSQQAPSGMVGVLKIEFPQIVEQVAQEVNR